MKGPGGRFEAQLRASAPKWPGLAVRKYPDPPARPFRCRCGGQIAPKCNRCGAQHGHPATFTRRNPWDIEIRWPAERGLYEMLIECKSTAVPRLPFDVVSEEQVAELRRQAGAGAFAGVMWESRALASPEVFWIPIDQWIATCSTARRKSWTAEMALEAGTVVQIDPSRGRKHHYYRLDRLLRWLSGEDKPQQAAKAMLF